MNGINGNGKWMSQWMENVLEPDPSKQAQDLIFSRRINKAYHPPLLFNNSTVQQIFVYVLKNN